MKLAAMVVFHTGDAEEAERELEPFKTWGSPLMVEVGPMPYPVMNTILDAAYPAGSLNYWLSSFTRGLPDELIDIAVDRFADRPVAHDRDPVRALPRRGDARRGDRDRRAAPRRRLEPPHPVRLDRPGGHRRERRRGRARRSPRCDRTSGAAAGSTTSATTRPTTRSAQPTAPTTSGSSRSSAATTPTTSSTSTTTSCRSTSVRLGAEADARAGSVVRCVWDRAAGYSSSTGCRGPSPAVRATRPASARSATWSFVKIADT